MHAAPKLEVGHDAAPHITRQRLVFGAAQARQLALLRQCRAEQLASFKVEGRIVKIDFLALGPGTGAQVGDDRPLGAPFHLALEVVDAKQHVGFGVDARLHANYGHRLGGVAELLLVPEDPPEGGGRQFQRIGDINSFGQEAIGEEFHFAQVVVELGLEVEARVAHLGWRVELHGDGILDVDRHARLGYEGGESRRNSIEARKGQLPGARVVEAETGDFCLSSG